MKFVWSMFGIMAAAAALATPPKDLARAKKGNDRMSLIWAHMESRLTQQGDIWFKTGDYPAAISSLRFLNSEDPNDYDFATSLGWMLENVNQYDEALAVYVRYRKDNPKAPDGPFPEANFYFAKKAYTRVPPLLSASLTMKPHPNSYRLLAHSYEKLGEYPDAIKVWKRLIADYPHDVAAPTNERKDEAIMQKQATTAGKNP